MPIYKPSELRQFLDSLNISPKKVLSQNFLIDGNIIRKIVSTAQVQQEDIVLEIGPGPGALTEALLDTGASVIAVEKDRMLAQALERLKTAENHLEVFCEDIMEFSVEDHMSARISEKKRAKVIANLPYHLTTPILAHFVPQYETFSHLVVMVQEEVARRFVAQPSTSDYSSFTVFLQFYTNPRYAFSVSRQCFFPVPKVDSAVVIFELKPPPKLEKPNDFFILTRTAFSQRRKMLRSSLKDLYGTEKVQQALEQLKINPQSRPENLAFPEWLHLFELLQLSA